MVIILQKDRIIDLSRMNEIRVCIKYGRYGEYELRAFGNRDDNIGCYVCDVPDRSEIIEILRFLAEIKHNNHLILTPQELIERYKNEDGKKTTTEKERV